MDDQSKNSDNKNGFAPQKRHGACSAVKCSNRAPRGVMTKEMLKGMA